MKITIYELLGLIKDGKAPKKIKIADDIFEYRKSTKSENEYHYYKYKDDTCSLTFNYYIENRLLNDEVEIIEDKPNKIKEKKIDKLPLIYSGNVQDEIMRNRYKLNELTKAVNYLLEKGDE